VFPLDSHGGMPFCVLVAGTVYVLVAQSDLRMFASALLRMPSSQQSPSKCLLWCRLHRSWSHSRLFDCTQCGAQRTGPLHRLAARERGLTYHQRVRSPAALASFPWRPSKVQNRSALSSRAQATCRLSKVFIMSVHPDHSPAAKSLRYLFVILFNEYRVASKIKSGKRTVEIRSVAMLARRFRVPYSVGLVLAGVVLSAFPGLPEVRFSKDGRDQQQELGGTDEG
jgi:hypothetical protein